MSAAPSAGGHRGLCVALDVDRLEALERLAAATAPHVAALKVGLEALVAIGPAAVERAAARAPAFVDAKLHDIPATVAGAARAAARAGAAMLSVHALGGPRMVAAAAEAAPATAVLAVTVLTSHHDDELADLGLAGTSAELVPRLAGRAVDAGAAGVVCSPHEAAAVRAEVGPGPLVVTPGVRPEPHDGVPGGGVGGDDQRRVASPGEAVAAGADLVVVGRPVTGADDPAAAAGRIAAEVRRAGRATGDDEREGADG